MNYTQIRSFNAVTKHLSFTKAAKVLSVSQSAISEQVKSVESRFKIKLFIRNGNGISLTDYGKKLYDITKDIRLTANTLATGAGLFVLITAFAEISGAHFNPFVSLAMYLTKKIKGKLLITYIPAQILGCLLGVMLANLRNQYLFAAYRSDEQ